MCGIVAYAGYRNVAAVLLKGLERLEYRGYDSAGIALMTAEGIKIKKKKGKVNILKHEVSFFDLFPASIGIGHTRWATHGVPNDVNAHPHVSSSGRLALIHNGIIENYESLKKELESKGYHFQSDTDTEVLVNLIENIQFETNTSLEDAIRLATRAIVGAYAIVVIEESNPDQLVAIRKGSPLVIGVGNNEFFLASDASPIVEYTKHVIYLEDLELATIKNMSLSIKSNDEQAVDPIIERLEFELEEIEKGGFDHFMLKEIFEQPRSIQDCFRGRVDADKGIVTLGGIRDHMSKMISAKRIIMTACGTSWHACLVGEYLFEEFARVPVEVEYASEFRYRNPIINENDLIIAVSQSGETADTLAAIGLAKSKGATVFGVCNVVGSSIARVTDAGSYTHAGPEIGVASTKAFSAQISVLAMFAIKLGYENGNLNPERYLALLKGIKEIPHLVEKVLKLSDSIFSIAEAYASASNFLYLGRGINFPVALEGALKLKEISYIHAEGYPAAEMKHGPIALIDSEMPVVIIAMKDGSYEKIVSNIQEVKARGGKVIAIVTEGDELVSKLADHTIELPPVNEHLSPLLSVIPLQLLAYQIAVLRGCNVDQPRNLAKSVTVE
ncbi:MAG: glutamine--fructose-6-phosphate transaminase (isomerizing) [Algoriphagus sp.]|uniref:glutamine--fructose-6-phosphate transaminase (isomerizing) n=1 Tax=Algoriphagus sp. TaxID=1872435 RepID=UPI0026316B90|nr:glutamine--fructose-6-phosphate transaminase (isomerizing) [Algoriphagus sp.]MDG1279232.1 glutamine--fructose-6-phosphate transaminase (isomerizing) [Algoriphagus sp.]